LAVYSVNSQTGFEREIADVIVEVLALPGVRGEDIVPDAPLFGDGLGLDSIDALEIAVAIAQRYGVQLRAEDEATKRVFANLRSLAQHVAALRADPKAG
jgi:acyl carrier protein